jgi:hypothetical protein
MGKPLGFSREGEIEMKSGLFTRFDPRTSEDFAKDLAHLLDLEDEKLKKVASYAVKDFESSTDWEEKLVIDAAGKDIPGASVARLISMGSWFLGKLLKEESKADSPESWIDDMLAMGVVSEKQAGKLLTYFEELFASSVKVREQRERDSVAVSGAPTVLAIAHVADVRGVFGQSPMGREDYVPECKSVIPVTLVTINLSDDMGKFTFQLDEARLDYVVNQLKAAKADLLSLQKYLGLEAKGK